MKIHKNIGRIDYFVRILLLLFFIWLAIKISPWFYLLVAWEIFILITGYCFVYDLLNINTLRW